MLDSGCWIPRLPVPGSVHVGARLTRAVARRLPDPPASLIRHRSAHKMRAYSSAARGAKGSVSRILPKEFLQRRDELFPVIKRAGDGSPIVRRRQSPARAAPDRDARFEGHGHLGQSPGATPDGHTQGCRQHVERVSRHPGTGVDRDPDPPIRIRPRRCRCGQDTHRETTTLHGAARRRLHDARATAGQYDPSMLGSQTSDPLSNSLFFGRRVTAP